MGVDISGKYGEDEWYTQLGYRQSYGEGIFHKEVIGDNDRQYFYSIVKELFFAIGLFQYGRLLIAFYSVTKEAEIRRVLIINWALKFNYN